MDRHRSRYSMAFSTPQNHRFTSSQPRRSVSALDFESPAVETFVETLMNDPAKRDIFVKLLVQDKHKIEEIRRKQGNIKKGSENPGPLRKVKRKFACESPIALLRRRALEKRNEDNLATTSSCVVTPSLVPFECLLQDVIAYVEVNCNNCDRSRGVKALMRAMGAIVKDTFTRDVTHVVFKDGLYNTYEKAKLMNVHLVSVLWLETIRRNHARVPEENYRALAISTYKTNLSLLCEEMQKEYEVVVQDELNQSMAMEDQNQDNLSITSSESNQSFDNLTEDVIDASQDCDAVSLITKASFGLQKSNATEAVFKIPDSLKLPSSPALTSDSDSSEVEVINGRAAKEVARSLLELTNDFNSGSYDVSSDKSKENSKESAKNTSTESTSLLINVKKSEIKRKCQRRLYNREDEEDGLFLPPSVDRQRKHTSSRLNIGNKEQKLITCQGSAQIDVEEMELRSVSESNDEYVTKRGKRFTSNNRDFDVESTKTKDDSCLEEPMPTIETSAKRPSTRNSSQTSTESKSKKKTKKSTSFNSEKKSSRKTDSTQELSSLRLSTDSSRTRSITTDNEGRCTTEAKVDDVRIGKRKSSSTQELSPLKLSVDSDTKSNLTNNEEATKPEKRSTPRTRKSTQELLALRISVDSHPKSNLTNNEEATKSEQQSTRKKRKSSSSQDLSSLRLSENTEENNEPNVNKSGSQDEPQKRKLRSESKISHENSVKSLDDALQASNDCISSKKVKHESPSISKQDANCKQIKKNVTESKENEVDHSESDSQVGPSKMTVRKSIRKTKIASEVAPKSPQQTSNVLPSPKKKMRRLYNLNDCWNDMPQSCDEEDNEERKRAEVVFKKPATVAPVLLTSSALAYVETLKLIQLNSYDFLNKRDNKIKETPKESQCPTPKSVRKANRKEDASSSIQITPQRNRRSTLEFTPKVIKTPAKLKGTQNNKRIKKATIVCTRFHRPEGQVFQQIVKKLGKFFIEDEVTEKTTHLVVGEPKRTINILRAIAKGCWILKSEWLYKSSEANEWLAEEDFELTEFSPAVQQCRQQQQAFGSLYSMDIFENCGPIYIARSSVPKCSNLQELVRLCKGEVTQIRRNALIVVGEFDRHNGVTCVVEKWILDSIMFNKKKAFKNYLITGK